MKPVVEVTSGRWRGRKGVLAGLRTSPDPKRGGAQTVPIFDVELWEHARRKARTVAVTGVRSSDDRHPGPCPKCGASNVDLAQKCRDTPSGRDHVERRMVLEQWTRRRNARPA